MEIEMKEEEDGKEGQVRMRREEERQRKDEENGGTRMRREEGE